MTRKYKKEAKQEKVVNWVMNVDATDPKYDPVKVLEIADERKECSECAHFNVDPRMGKCRIGEVQYRNIRINCTKYRAKVKIASNITNERFWE